MLILVLSFSPWGSSRERKVSQIIVAHRVFKGQVYRNIYPLVLDAVFDATQDEVVRLLAIIALGFQSEQDTLDSLWHLAGGAIKGKGLHVRDGPSGSFDSQAIIMLC